MDEVLCVHNHTLVYTPLGYLSSSGRRRLDASQLDRCLQMMTDAE